MQADLWHGSPGAEVVEIYFKTTRGHILPGRAKDRHLARDRRRGQIDLLDELVIDKEGDPLELAGDINRIDRGACF